MNPQHDSTRLCLGMSELCKVEKIISTDVLFSFRPGKIPVDHVASRGVALLGEEHILRQEIPMHETGCMDIGNDAEYGAELLNILRSGGCSLNEVVFQEGNTMKLAIGANPVHFPGGVESRDFAWNIRQIFECCKKSIRRRMSLLADVNESMFIKAK